MNFYTDIKTIEMLNVIFIQEHPYKGVLRKDVLKLSSKFTGDHSCGSAISIKLKSNFVEDTSARVFSGNLPHIFRTPFPKNTFGRLLLFILISK